MFNYNHPHVGGSIEPFPNGSRLMQYIHGGPMAQSAIPPHVPGTTREPHSLGYVNAITSFTNMSLTSNGGPSITTEAQTSLAHHHHLPKMPPPAGYVSGYVSDGMYDGRMADEYEPQPSSSRSDNQAYGYRVLPTPEPKPKGPGSPSFFLPNDVKAELVKKQMDMHNSSTPHETISAIGEYHDLVRIDHATPGSMEIVYKGFSSVDGLPRCLRRIPNARPLTTKQILACENWKSFAHPSIVRLREVQQTREFGDLSLLFVYDYHPLAKSFRTYHFGSSTAKAAEVHQYANGHIAKGLPENLIWTYIIQISSALRCIHGSGASAKCIDPTRILTCGTAKALIGSCGIIDVIHMETNSPNILPQQAEDLCAFGRLLLILATGKLTASNPENASASLKFVERNYSPDLKNVVKFLYNAIKNVKPTSINEIMPMIGARFYAQLDYMQVKNDVLEDALSKEMENGRLFRLICKLNTVNERADPNMVDSTWSETGDRYLLKLFRDYVFHQVTDNGKPWVDMSHIVLCLNKLDAGTDDFIQLVSRDGDNVLIVSYKDLRNALDNAFGELLKPVKTAAASRVSS